MDVTNRTLEDILKELLESGHLGVIICCLLVGLAVGIILTSLYFKKIRYYGLENELSVTKTALEKAEHERDEYKAKIEDLETRIAHFQNVEFVRLSTGPDAVPLP